ncbi:hypothetical protein SKAU_G00369880 [Synaphobranchus kaupii]|uniref:Uncharacterized protein n=1 Tax=Synaphobranchus kaupii TaxID=118154 RepID=A0A9Q1EFW1_SYNKA|nr:hypothetical protein SKAU_G00369880 [Synaphobranchus kaupii]
MKNILYFREEGVGRVCSSHQSVPALVGLGDAESLTFSNQLRQATVNSIIASDYKGDYMTQLEALRKAERKRHGFACDALESP